MEDIPLNVEVRCADGPCGLSTHVIINPVTQEVTHLVVREGRSPHTERLIPIDWVVDSTPKLIRLGCTETNLREQELFIEIHFYPAQIDQANLSGYLAWPYVTPKTIIVPVDEERIPPGELAVRRGAHVQASDGRVGQVDEFLIDPATGHITHLVLREGHLWGKKDVTIPVSQIDHMEENTVYLKLDKRAIGSLPSIPLRRHYSKARPQ